jgi:hypothetical protein
VHAPVRERERVSVNPPEPTRLGSRNRIRHG